MSLTARFRSAVKTEKCQFTVNKKIISLASRDKTTLAATHRPEKKQSRFGINSLVKLAEREKEIAEGLSCSTEDHDQIRLGVFA
jgi:hypothetical protein